MAFKIKTEEEFIPTTIKNEDNEQPIKFHLKYMNSVERDGVINLEFIDGQSHVKPDFVKACKMGIMSIENLVINEKTIKTADDFLRYPLHDTMLEVGKVILMMNPMPNEDALKNSR
jgi:hypothetical protein